MLYAPAVSCNWLYKSGHRGDCASAYLYFLLPSSQQYIIVSFNSYSYYPQVWLCGGSMEVLPCSRVAHIARMKKPYHSNIAFHTRLNALRVAEVWMDEYKSNVYLAWNIPMEVRTAFFCTKTSLREDAVSHACLFVTIRCPCSEPNSFSFGSTIYVETLGIITSFALAEPRYWLRRHITEGCTEEESAM